MLVLVDDFELMRKIEYIIQDVLTASGADFNEELLDENILSECSGRILDIIKDSKIRERDYVKV